jgi:DNA-binding response OmpR family regulator
LLEDSEADIFLFREAVRNYAIAADVTVVHDGERGLKLLQQDHFKPDLIILDLNLSVMSGHDFLQQCCSGSDGPPVVVLSGSLNDKDRELALELGAREYIRKPSDLRYYFAAVQGILERWGNQGKGLP